MGLDLEVPDFSTLSRHTENFVIPDLSTMLEPNEIVNLVIDSTGLKIYETGEWQTVNII